MDGQRLVRDAICSLMGVPMHSPPSPREIRMLSSSLDLRPTAFSVIALKKVNVGKTPFSIFSVVKQTDHNAGSLQPETGRVVNASELATPASVHFSVALAHELQNAMSSNLLLCRRARIWGQMR
ncbi:unnamed protein product [Dibothriocephalus latus]|uniref:Uncharacterized protein n=1 Tax=Dibothriocephalus latus TaxID=60516 RepID=A0A3P7NY75_DIBLA|nr:unnamed protein product [Dibothriocephalus latus]